MVLRAKVKGDVAPNVVSVTVDPGLLGPATQEMDRTTEFHRSLREKWSLPPSDSDPGYVHYSLPMKVAPQAEPLTCEVCEATIRVVDIAGQEVNLGGSSGAKVNLVETRQRFNVYLMPGLNFVSTPLQCSAGAPACSTESEFDIATLLNQPATNAAVGATLADVVSNIWYYCAKSTDATCPGSGDEEFISYLPGRPTNLLETIGTSKGYIIVTKESAFNKKTEGTQFPSTQVPVPIKLSFSGEVNTGPPNSVPMGTAVKPVWNLIGLQSERDSTVGNLVSNVDTEVAQQRLWVQLFGFKNNLDILLDGEGNVVRDSQGKPLISLVRSVLQNLFSRSEVVAAGGSFWLEMCDDPARPQCSNSIGPVLELR